MTQMQEPRLSTCDDPNGGANGLVLVMIQMEEPRISTCDDPNGGATD